MAYGHLSASEFKTSTQSPSRDLNSKPFGGLNEGAMAHGGIAIRSNTKFDGLGAESMKFEGLPAQSASDAKQVENSGRGD